MRSYLVVGLACVVGLAAACGGKTEVQEPGGGGSAGSAGQGGAGGGGGSGGVGGTGGNGGSNGGSGGFKDGGTGNGGTSPWTGCDQAGTCVLEPMGGCCASCDPTTSDTTAVYWDKAGAYMQMVCPEGPASCGACPEPTEANTLKAFCENGLCQAVDIETHDVTACTKHADCQLVLSSCCGPCDPTIAQVVAVATSQMQAFQNQICNPYMDYACPGCIPQFPTNLSAACDPTTHHCKVEKTFPE